MSMDLLGLLFIHAAQVVVFALNHARYFWAAILIDLKRLGIAIRDGLVEENGTEIWLVRPLGSVIGYIVLLVVATGAIIAADGNDATRPFIHPDKTDEMVVGATGLMFALLVPVAIVLIEDARNTVLERQAFVKSIIRLWLMPVVLLYICIFLFLPEGQHLFGTSITVKSLAGGGVVCAFVLILTTFYRAYRWLGDGTSFSSGSPEAPDPDAQQPDTFRSYRFARIVRLLKGSKGYETWHIIWSRWQPPRYEYVLHDIFFARVDKALASNSKKQYSIVAAELSAYAKYLGKRNRAYFYYYARFSGRFIRLQAELENKMDPWPEQFLGWEELELAHEAVYSVNKQLIDDWPETKSHYGLFKAMDEYIGLRSLNTYPLPPEKRYDNLLTYFVRSFFDTIYDGTKGNHRYSKFQSAAAYWEVTSDAINEYPASLIISEAFDAWLFEKLQQSQNDPDDKVDLKLGHILKLVFVKADPPVLSSLYWIQYLHPEAQDAESLVRSYCMLRQKLLAVPRAHLYSPKFDTNWDQDYAQRREGERNEAVILFTLLHWGDVTTAWDLTALIDAADRLKDEMGSDEVRAARLEELHELLTDVRDVCTNLRRP